MIKRKIDAFGRIVVPKEVRDTLNLKNGSTIDMTIVQDGILIRRGEGVCLICGEECNADDQFQLCHNCLTKIRKAKAVRVARTRAEERPLA